MGWFYKVDLRRRAVTAVNGGVGRVEVQRLFQVSCSTLACLRRQLKAHSDERLRDHCRR